MKLPSGLLMLCLALTVLIRAELAAPMKTEAPVAKRELVWPEIKDPQALIDFAKAEIAKVKARRQKWGKVDEPELTEIAYLHPGYCEIFASNDPTAQMVVWLKTRPFNGQAVIIVPFLREFDTKQKESSSSAEIIDTVTPEIKWALMPLALKSCFVSEMKSFESFTVSVNWRNIQNLDEDKNTWPIPLEMQLPAYPDKMIRIRSNGEAKVEFTVSDRGLISALHVTATSDDFASVVREAAQFWKFEPGVDAGTHLPAATRIVLTVRFDGFEPPVSFDVIKD